MSVTCCDQLERLLELIINTYSWGIGPWDFFDCPFCHKQLFHDNRINDKIKLNELAKEHIKKCNGYTY